eukprot:TRINITY_DN66377_c2_g6_i1.p1 TRINITY_DN66377_c2_g6~~TRINITY_DN66377_c2_g6_i1.p1  ORF type:complete len:617 (+),score=65.24 TRINITY_DN66377_c2_g6_i1:207-1853(+)
MEEEDDDNDGWNPMYPRQEQRPDGALSGCEHLEAVNLVTGQRVWSSPFKEVSPTDLRFINMLATYKFLFVECQHNLYGLHSQTGLLMYRFEVPKAIRRPLNPFSVVVPAPVPPQMPTHWAPGPQAEDDDEDEEEEERAQPQATSQDAAGEYYTFAFDSPCFIVEKKSILVCPSTNNKLAIFGVPQSYPQAFGNRVTVCDFPQHQPIRVRYPVQSLCYCSNDLVVYDSHGSTVAVTLPSHQNDKSQVKVVYRDAVSHCTPDHLLFKAYGHMSIVDYDKEVVLTDSTVPEPLLMIEDPVHKYVEAVVGLESYRDKGDFDELLLDFGNPLVRERMQHFDRSQRQEVLDLQWDEISREYAQQKQQDPSTPQPQPLPPAEKRPFEEIEITDQLLRKYKRRYSSVIVAHSVHREKKKNTKLVHGKPEVHRYLVPAWRCEITCKPEDWGSSAICRHGGQLYFGYLTTVQRHRTSVLGIHCISIDCGIERWSATTECSLAGGCKVEICYRHGTVVLCCHAWREQVTVTFCAGQNGKATCLRTGALLSPRLSQLTVV